MTVSHDGDELVLRDAGAPLHVEAPCRAVDATLSGGRGDDRLTGCGEDDTIVGGRGRDRSRAAAAPTR